MRLALELPLGKSRNLTSFLEHPKKLLLLLASAQPRKE
jgi:hypothetical protein